MSNDISDETVSQFLAITGSSDAQQANSYIEMANNDLQTAVDLFFQYSSAPPASTGAGTGVGSGSGLGPPMGVDDQVRAPDQTRSETLIGAGPSYGGLMQHSLFGPHAAAMMGGAPRSGPGLGGYGMGAFADDEEDMLEAVSGSLRDMTNRAAAAATADSSDNAEVQDVTDMHTGVARANNGGGGSIRASSLSDMFAPPRHLIHSAGGFQGARNVAKDSRRWLLVNLQSDSNFSCHALNRDVWGDELVENLVRSGFVFWQSEDTAEDGRTYAQRYNVQSFPHIGIIDPRTARLMYRNEGWTQEKPLTAVKFAEAAADFCSRHSFDSGPVAPRSSSAGNGSSSSSGVDGRDPQEMTEEQQLQAAIQASMNRTPAGGDDDDDDVYDDDESVEYPYNDDDDDDDGADDMSLDYAPAETTQVVAAKEEEKPSFQDEIIAMEVGEEPKEKAARIMIRMPDGKRLVRKFNLDDTVKMIYAFVAQSNEDAKNGKEFELKAGFPPKNLLGSIDESIASTGLAGDNITVRWKED